MEVEQKRKSGKQMRLSDTAEGLLHDLTVKLGLKQTGVVELAIRRLATAEGLPIPGAANLSTGAPSAATANGSPVGATSGE